MVGLLSFRDHSTQRCVEPAGTLLLSAEAVGVLACTWTVVRRIDAADARARPIVAAGIAVLAAPTLGGMPATPRAGWYVAGLGPTLSLATALPSLGIQVGAWALPRPRSASHRFQEHGPESEDSTR